MYKLGKIVSEDTVQAMALQPDGGGFYGTSVFDGLWYTGTKKQLVKAGIADIKKPNVRVVRTFL